jgi:hypothetical protein
VQNTLRRLRDFAAIVSILRKLPSPCSAARRNGVRLELPAVGVAALNSSYEAKQGV